MSETPERPDVLARARAAIVELLFRIQPQKPEPVESPEAPDDAEEHDEPETQGPPAFDEDDWGADDDGIDWDAVVARESLQRIAAAMDGEARAAAAAAAAQAGAPGTLPGGRPPTTASLSGMGDDDGG